ncbi:bidirectional sugar transporter SWEET4-like [Prunus avium]|uniref:Bidirectional sugar transporter SWEET4-like n=1 Tax=Prunus avium TaxID=42229 RepID=A0A6P5T163_PRUAV|nr:bidirectional sugar transporter SWEET4-like [Prunus avium]
MVGIVCDIFNIIMYGSPLTIMAKVIKTKSVKYMPFYLSLTNFLNGCCWTAYALIKFDIYMLVSNGLGAVSGAIQLILYAAYCKSTPKDDDDLAGKPTTTEVQLSNTNAAAAARV